MRILDQRKFMFTTFLWMLFMMRAANELIQRGYDPRLLFVFNMIKPGTEKEFFEAIEKYKRISE
jgi:hypothetical protein